MKTWHTSGKTSVTRILSGRSNVYLVRTGSAGILVDTGWSRDRKRLLGHLQQLGAPAAVVMTHTHFDHTGNAASLKEQFSPVFIVQEREQAFLASGDSPLPQGTRPLTRFIRGLGAERVPHWFHVPGVPADISFSDRFDLNVFGVDAFVMHTPGHSPGSSTVVAGKEIALAGDTLHGIGRSPFPPWGDDAAAILKSWKKLLDTGCHTFHPSHGWPVCRKKLEKYYLRLTR